MAPRTRVVALLACLALGAASPSRAALCENTSTGFLPLPEMGSSTYLGQIGGLYPGGSNAPPAGHASAGFEIANAVEPLDTLGVPAASGRIVLLGVGMSNTAQEMSAFVPLANAYAQKNPRVLIVNGAQGGQTASVFADPNAPAWQVIDDRLRMLGSSPTQVQIVWLKEANARPTAPFPDHAQALRDDLRAVVRNLRARYPNVRLCYLSSRTYGGYASTTLNPEPYAYESAFAVRWLIEEQIGGSAQLNFDPEVGPVVAPWLSWGPYLWADGLTPRADGLTWACSDFNDDGTHPSTSGRAKVADLLLDFFVTDPTTTPWFVASTTGAELPPASRVWFGAPSPNPFSHAVRLPLHLSAGERLRIEIFGADGRIVCRLPEVVWPEGSSVVVWDGTDETGTRVPAGFYFVRAVTHAGNDVARTRVLRLP